MKMEIMQEPTTFIMIEEVREGYIERLVTIKTNRCTLEEAKKRSQRRRLSSDR
jgi:hypothetical protein